MYATCGKKYFYHYHEKLRESVTSAALLFGSALDATLNPMLLDLKAGNLKPLEDYQIFFSNNWLEGRINNEFVSLPMSLQIAYADADYDEELLTPEDVKEIARAFPSNTYDFNYEKLAEEKKIRGIENLNPVYAEFINYSNWHCLLRKGRLMIATYYTQVLPKIKEVVDVQVKIELDNDEGDSVIGYIDAILDFGDGPRIVDNKTAARAYEDGAANISPQLAIYAYSKHITKTAFVVLSKQIKKNRTKICTKCGHDGSGSRAKTCDKGEGKLRCHGEWLETTSPEAQVEILLGEVNSVFQNNVLDNYEETLKAIRADAFPRNFSSCMAYGRKCPYFNKCHVDPDDDTGLVKT